MNKKFELSFLISLGFGAIGWFMGASIPICFLITAFTLGAARITHLIDEDEGN